MLDYKKWDWKKIGYVSLAIGIVVAAYFMFFKKEDKDEGTPPTPPTPPRQNFANPMVG